MSRSLSLKKVDENTGQVPGLPANPRFIRDERFAKLKRSIEDFPEMLKIREIVVYPFEGRYVCIGGNMRRRACEELGIESVPAKILPADFPVAKLREFAIKDNTSFGETDSDILSNDWADMPLDEWGFEFAEIETFTPNLEPEMSVRQVTAEDIIKTKQELEENFQDPDKYKEVICPHCAEIFYIKDE